MPVAVTQSNADGAELAHRQRKIRGFTRFLLHCAAVSAVMHSMFVAAQPAAQPGAASVTTARADSPVQLVVSVRLNGVAKGDFVAYMTADRDFLLPPRE